jgi:hypothetical protein
MLDTSINAVAFVPFVYKNIIVEDYDFLKIWQNFALYKREHFIHIAMCPHGPYVTGNFSKLQEWGCIFFNKYKLTNKL